LKEILNGLKQHKKNTTQCLYNQETYVNKPYMGELVTE